MTIARNWAWAALAAAAPMSWGQAPLLPKLEPPRPGYDPLPFKAPAAPGDDPLKLPEDVAK